MCSHLLDIIRLFRRAHHCAAALCSGSTSVVNGKSGGWNFESTACGSQSATRYVLFLVVNGSPNCASNDTRLAQGKDEHMLCSLNNFDAYVVSRVSKAPKPFVFAVKSTDNLSYFESTADYVHVFCCSELEGQNWLEKILLARVSVLGLLFRREAFVRLTFSSSVLHPTQRPHRPVKQYHNRLCRCLSVSLRHPQTAACPTSRQLWRWRPRRIRISHLASARL